jgi:hypothetical protein
MQTPRHFWRGVRTKPGDNLLSPAKDYHRPWMLNGRVRNGNGCDHPGMLTEKAHGVPSIPLPDGRGSEDALYKTR